jgi:xanthine dehydrogenase YagS FAD-binding subunit
MKRFEYVLPRTMKEAIAEVAGGGVARAGGIDLIDLMKEGILAPKRLVGLGCADTRIEVTPASLTIGAGATLADVASHPEIRRRWPALAAAAGDAATPQVRNVATVAGNVLQANRCWYYRTAEFDCHRKGGEGCPALDGENQYHAIFGDRSCPAVHPSNLAPVLAALDAKVVFAAGGEPEPVTALWPAGNPRLVAHFELATPLTNAYVEVRHRQSYDWALAAAAVARFPERPWRVWLGAVAPVPWRSAAAEAILGTKRPDAKAIAAAADAAVLDAKPLTKNGYKVKLARTALLRALTEAAGGLK